jgi:hypothetical protein
MTIAAHAAVAVAATHNRISNMSSRPVVLLLLGATPFTACLAQGTTRGASAITEMLIRRHVNVIAHDSMKGRDTPSRGLDLTARYVANQFRRLGLAPGGDSGTFLQHYHLTTRKLDGPGSAVRLAAGGVEAVASFERDARIVTGARSGASVTGPVTLIAGTLDSASIGRANLRGRSVLLVGDFQKGLDALNAALNQVMSAGPGLIVALSNRESGAFAQRVQAQFREELTVGMDESALPPVVEVHERAVRGVLAAAGIDLAQLRGASETMVRALDTLQMSATVVNATVKEARAPNTVGILEGTDPVLKDEYIVFSAHMDHVGVNRVSGKDSIWNGADDDASGTAGVLALAEAFARAPTKRSMIFLTVSGEEKGLWGSEWFAANPPVPVEKMVANLNLDMIGRNWKDTIVVIGKEHSDLGETLNRVNAAHPELGMSAIDDLWPQEQFYFRSDHYNFAKRGVPILFFFNGTHADYHQPSDSPEKIDAEKESRIVKLIFYVAREVGDAVEKPQWNAESYRKIVKP